VLKKISTKDIDLAKQHGHQKVNLCFSRLANWNTCVDGSIKQYTNEACTGNFKNIIYHQMIKIFETSFLSYLLSMTVTLAR
jgi:hypothetical protein